MQLRHALVRTSATLAALTMTLLGVAGPAAAHDGGGDLPTNTRGLQVETEGEGKRMSFVANLQYDDTGKAQSGSDIEFVTIDGRDYALAGTLRKGLQIIDITQPRKPEGVAVYDCDISQGDVQIWRNRGRVLASYTADGTFGATGAASQCAKDLKLDAASSGTVIVDVTTPSEPRSVSFLSVPRGSHNMTIHPSGDYLYNSNSDLITSAQPTITIYDISSPESPKKVQDYPIPFVPASLGSESHDITFNRSGTRAYSAALSQTLILDTSDPRNPEQVSQIIDPTINVMHQSDPVTLRGPDGDKRRLVVITDERAGAVGSAECPGGGLHVYDVTGAKESSPEKVGAWFIPTTKVQDGARCTSHVLRMYPKQGLMTIAWYAQGVRVIDISGLATAQPSPVPAIGEGIGMREIGHFVMPDADTWSFKTNEIARDGSFFGYGNDLVRGFDVYEFKGFAGDKRVPALKTRNITPPAESDTSRMLLPLAVVLPSLVVAGVLRRRSRRH